MEKASRRGIATGFSAATKFLPIPDGWAHSWAIPLARLHVRRPPGRSEALPGGVLPTLKELLFPWEVEPQGRPFEGAPPTRRLLPAPTTAPRPG